MRPDRRRRPRTDALLAPLPAAGRDPGLQRLPLHHLPGGGGDASRRCSSPGSWAPGSSASSAACRSGRTSARSGRRRTRSRRARRPWAACSSCSPSGAHPALGDLRQRLRLARGARDHRLRRHRLRRRLPEGPQPAEPRPHRARQVPAPGARRRWRSGSPCCVLPAESGFDPTLTFPFIKRLVLHLGCFYIPFVAFVLVGVLQRRQPDRRAGRPGDRRHDRRRRHLRHLHLRRRQPGDRRLPAALLRAGRRASWRSSAAPWSAPASASSGSTPTRPRCSWATSARCPWAAAIGSVAVIAKKELLLVLVGGVFVVEALSVIIQVASFKLRGKRVFRMAPLHHHFELTRLGRAARSSCASGSSRSSSRCWRFRP